MPRYPFHNPSQPAGGVWPTPPPFGGSDLTDIIHRINLFATNHGYAVSIVRQDVPYFVVNDKGEEEKYYAQATLGCVYGGVYNGKRNNNVRGRAGQTIKTDCKFRIKVTRDRTTHEYQPFVVVSAEHNHLPAAPGRLAAHRRLDPLDRARAIDLMQNQPDRFTKSLSSRRVRRQQISS
jgi:hypothetical protein